MVPFFFVFFLDGDFSKQEFGGGGVWGAVEGAWQNDIEKMLGREAASLEEFYTVGQKTS